MTFLTSSYRYILIFAFLFLSLVAQGQFVTTWETTEVDETITIPTYSGESYSYTVDWGDGIIDETVYADDASHTYAAVGTYTVSILGTFPGIYVSSSSSSKAQIRTIEAWGDGIWKRMDNAFSYCPNLVSNATDVPNLTEVTSLQGMFKRSTLFNGDLSQWDVSNVTTMEQMFYEAKKFNSDISEWDVSKVETMEGMFGWAWAFDGDLSEWNVSNVKDMENMFDYAKSFNSDISDWDVSAVTNMIAMFSGATVFNSDLSKWDVSKVTRMDLMFWNTEAFNQDLGNWDISSVTSLDRMLDVSNLSADNYDKTLIGWATLDDGETQIPSNITLGCRYRYYCLAGTERNILTNDYGWTLADDRYDCAPVPDEEFLFDIMGVCEVTEPSEYPTATDDDDGVVTATTTASFPISKSTTIEWVFTESNGNFSVQTQYIDILDDELPTPSEPALDDIVAVCEVSSLIAPSATDNCTLESVTHDATLPITVAGTTKVIWTYTDVAGNRSTQTQNVIITDDEAPVADEDELEDITAQCEVNSLTDPSATDNCTEVTISHDATLPITTQGTTVVTWTYSDENGNSSTQVQNVMITDDMAPEPEVEGLADIIAQCEVTSLTEPSATDNCTEVTISHNATLPITTQGTTVVTWTYSDDNGNSSIQTQNVIITDDIAPEPERRGLSKVYAQCEVTSLTEPTATDNCTEVTVSHDATLPITAQGTTVVTWTYADDNGNSSIQTQNVTITDDIAPAPDQGELETIIVACEVTSLTPPSATDNCSEVTVSHDAVLPITEKGFTYVTWVYTDQSGNTSSQTQLVQITDHSPPVPDEDELEELFVSECEVITLEYPRATDNCSEVTVTHDAALPITEPGTTLVTWTYTDVAGNFSNQPQWVTVGCVTSVEDFDSGITVYPNPANESFQISGVSLPILEVQIFDFSGRMVKSFSRSQEYYDISDLTDGMFTVNLIGKSDNKILRLLKK